MSRNVKFIPRLSPIGALPDWVRNLTGQVTLVKPAAVGKTEFSVKRRAQQNCVVTFETRNGAMESRSILIPGGAMVDAIEALARRALFTQHDISGVTILRVLFDFTATPANHEALARITRDYSDRIRFESECG